MIDMGFWIWWLKNSDLGMFSIGIYIAIIFTFIGFALIYLFESIFGVILMVLGIGSILCYAIYLMFSRWYDTFKENIKKDKEKYKKTLK